MTTEKRYHITPQSIYDKHCFKCKCELVSTDFCSDEDAERYRSLEEECNLERGYPKTKKQMEEWSIANVKYNEARYRVANDALRWQATGGYAGFYDCEKRTLVLCSKCTDEILGKYIRVNDVMCSSKKDYHHKRRSERKDDEIKMRWKARSERRALKKLLENTHKEEKEKRQM